MSVLLAAINERGHGNTKAALEQCRANTEENGVDSPLVPHRLHRLQNGRAQLQRSTCKYGRK